jgi:hypothetical protein
MSCWEVNICKHFYIKKTETETSVSGNSWDGDPEYSEVICEL